MSSTESRHSRRPAPQRGVTRRRVMIGGAAAAGVVALSGAGWLLLRDEDAPRTGSTRVGETGSSPVPTASASTSPVAYQHRDPKSDPFESLDLKNTQAVELRGNVTRVSQGWSTNGSGQVKQISNEVQSLVPHESFAAGPLQLVVRYNSELVVGGQVIFCLMPDDHIPYFNSENGTQPPILRAIGLMIGRDERGLYARPATGSPVVFNGQRAYDFSNAERVDLPEMSKAAQMTISWCNNAVVFDNLGPNAVGSPRSTAPGRLVFAQPGDAPNVALTFVCTGNDKAKVLLYDNSSYRQALPGAIKVGYQEPDTPTARPGVTAVSAVDPTTRTTLDTPTITSSREGLDFGGL